MQELNRHNHEQVPDYQASLDAIISRPLMPEFIDSYAEDALDDLIELVQDCIQGYQNQTSTIHESTRATEEAAFSYYGLGDIEAILDHISNKADEIKQLDDVIATRTQVVDRVVVPPDPFEIVPSNGQDTEFEHSKPIPKLKALLFILSNEFEVDVNDPEQLSLTTGVINESMMRRTSYTVVELAELLRTIFICDEIDNATYVFADDVMRENDITADDLMGLTKTDINNLLAENPSLGKRVLFREHFIDNLIDAIKDPAQDVVRSDDSREERKYLCPPATEGIVSNKQFAKGLRLADATIRMAVAELGESLGPVNSYRFKGARGIGYSPEQQAMIKQRLEATGVINNLPPEDYLTKEGIAGTLGIDPGSVGRAISSLGDSLGIVGVFKFGANSNHHKLRGYSPEQQAMIHTQLEANGMFLEEPPEGFLAIIDIADNMSIADQGVKETIEELGNALGTAKRYKSGSVVTVYYSPEQQAMIHTQLEAKGTLTDKAPEGYLSTRGLARSFKVDYDAVVRAIGELGEELGETPIYKFGPIAVGYSPEQQAMIHTQLEAKGMFIDKTPEGYHSRSSLARELDISRGRVNGAIKALANNLGETHIYMIGSRLVTGYSPEQQEMIRQYCTARKRSH
jgi:hypothetical protein